MDTALPDANTNIVKRDKWWKIQWYSDDDTPEERRLIRKLDLIIVPFAMVAYWVKYLDQANLNNAYVSGMKEDLSFHGNELVTLQTLYIVGTAVGQIPMLFLFTYAPMHWLIPGMDIGWSVFTLLQYRATSFAEMAAYRFFVGWFEAAFYPAMHYVFGCWYRGHEISRRGGFFYLGASLGNLTAGLITSGTVSGLDGVNGLAGWRWMYIICAVITFPVGIVGFFLIPGTHDMPNRLILTDKDLEVSRKRLERDGHVVRVRYQFKLSTVIKIFRDARFWVVVLVEIFFWNGGLQRGTGGFLLWLKSLKRYSVPKVNQYGTIQAALGIPYTLLAGFGSDLLVGPAWAVTLSSIWNAVSLIILTVWNVPEGALWFAFLSVYWSYAFSSVLLGWVNNILRAAPEERGFVLVMVTLIAQSSTAWTQILVFPTVEQPRFPKGYPFCLGCALALILSTWLLKWYTVSQEKKRLSEESSSEQGVKDVDQGTTDINFVVAPSKPSSRDRTSTPAQ